MKKIGILILFLTASVICYGQDLYKEMETMINPFTGDMNWTKQITSVSSSSSLTVPIILSYNSNIRTNDNASWVGLGFNLFTGGEIIRELNGAPDEKNGFSIYDRQIYNQSVVQSQIEDTKVYGPMEYYNLENPAIPSLITSDHISDMVQLGFQGVTGVYPMAAYDKFHLTSPSINGSFSLTNSSISNNNVDLRSKPFSTTEWSDPHTGTDYDYKSFDWPGPDNYTMNVMNWDHDPYAINFIEFFQKKDLPKPTSPGINDKTNLFRPYLDEADQTYAYSASSIESEDIVAFTIVLKNGTKLYYSLPVIQHSTRSYHLKVNDQTNQVDPSDTIFFTEYSSYVKSWKLTAIEGPNYVDKNGNGKLDEADGGDWVRFYYTKWGDNNQTRIPFHGFLPSDGLIKNKTGYKKDVFNFQSSVQIEESDQYYLDRISTDVQTLIFYKSLRNDDYQLNWDWTNPSPGYSYIPALKLDKISKYLAGNHIIPTNNSISSTNFSNVNSLRPSGQFNTYLIEDYNATPQAAHMVQEYDFTYDYSLAPGYYGNVENTGSLPIFLNIITGGTTGSTHLPDEVLYDVFNAYGNKGKLSLVDLTTLDYNSINLSGGSYQFIYDPTNNPSYNHVNIDNHGFYNSRLSNHTGNRMVPINENSGNPPWLLKSIINPSGNKVEIDYEKDRYEKIASGIIGNQNSMVIPIKEINVLNYNPTHILMRVTLYNENDKDALEAFANRDIEFHATYTGCVDPNITLPQGINPKRRVWAYGLTRFDNTASPIINSTLSITNYEPDVNNPEILEINVKYNAIDIEEVSCTLSNGSIALDERPYFEVRDQEYIGSGNRVSEMRLYENSTTSDYFKISPNYYHGVIGSVKSPYRTNGYTLVNNSPISTFNTIPPINGYESVKLETYDLLSDLKESTVYRYDHSERFFTANSRITNGRDCECYIPSAFFKIPFWKLWEWMHDTSSVELPDLLDCYVNGYIDEEVLPGTGINYSDYEGVLQLLQNWTYENTTVENLLWGKNGAQNLYCYRGIAECGGQQISWSGTCGGTPSMLDKFFPYYHDPINISPIIQATLINNSQLFGLPTEKSQLDKHGQITSQTKYTYQPFARSLERFRIGYQKTPSGDPFNSEYDGVFKLHYSYRYFKATELRVVSSGVEGYSSNYHLDGLLKTSDAASPISGYSINFTDYLHENEDYFNRISHIGSSMQFLGDPNVPVIEYNESSTAIDYTKKNYLVETSNTNRIFQIFDHDWLTDYNRRDQVLETKATTDVLTGSEQYNKLDLTNGLPTVLSEPLSATGKVILSKGVTTEINGQEVSSTQITLFNDDLIPLEAYSELSKQYYSILYGNNGLLQLGAIGNCQYKSFTASGFEFDEGFDFFEGEVLGSNNRYQPTASDITSAHTGRWVAKVDAQRDVIFVTDQLDKSKSHLEEGRSYTAMVWVNNKTFSGDPYLNVSLHGSLDGGLTSYLFTQSAYLSTAEITVGDWSLLKINFQVPANYSANSPTALQVYGGEDPLGTNRLLISLNSTGGPSYFDDLRFQPIEANFQMSIFDQNRMIITEVLGHNNFFTKNIVDEAGRTLEIWMETPDGIKLIEQNVYND